MRITRKVRTVYDFDLHGCLIWAQLSDAPDFHSEALVVFVGGVRYYVPDFYFAIDNVHGLDTTGTGSLLSSPRGPVVEDLRRDTSSMHHGVRQPADSSVSG